MNKLPKLVRYSLLTTFVLLSSFAIKQTVPDIIDPPAGVTQSQIAIIDPPAFVSQTQVAIIDPPAQPIQATV
jgi:hypothetical protein